MPAQNSLMQFAIKELDSNFAKRLGRIVKKLADGQEDGNLNQNRRKLFFEIEPFAREFDEYPTEPLVRENYDEYAEWINRRLNSVKGQGLKKYRAMFFGWLCYYHREEAEGLIKDFDAELPLYVGHPELNDCSDEAKFHFRRQEPLKEISTPASIVINQESEGADGDMLSDNEPDIEASSTTVKNFPRVVLAMFGAALLAGTGIALYSLGLFELPKDGSNDIATSNEADIEPETDVEETMPETEAEDDIPIENGDAKEDKGPDEKAAQEASPPPTPKQVNPVWDKITDFDWSTKVLRYFYPYVRQSNRADLLEAARQGNSNAQTLAAIGYHVGIMGNGNHETELTQFLEPACRAGQGRACTLAAVHYRRSNMGVPKNNATAASYYGQGCQKGSAMGCHYEGVRYYYGEGVPQDITKALDIFRRSCQRGVGYSCWYLAASYAQGASVPQDMNQARIYYNRARELVKPDSYAPFEQAFRVNQAQAFQPEAAQQ